MNDIAVIPPAAHQPQVDAADTILAGIVLEENATVSVVNSGSALYIIGDGDLDGDGWSDQYERDLSTTLDDFAFDIDHDFRPNFADDDADGDYIPDACEIEYMHIDSDYFHPYISRASLPPDFDGDGYNDAQECARGSSPIDVNDVPMPLLEPLGLGVAVAIFVGLSVWMLRMRRAGTRAIIALFWAMGLLSVCGYLGTQPLLAAAGLVDFSRGETIEGLFLPDTFVDGATITIHGGSVRPWNGVSTYASKPLTLLAENGPVFLGGMRAALSVGVLGEGSLGVRSSYDRPDHRAKISFTIVAGSRETEVFLGERVWLTPEPETGWGFRGWEGDAMGSDNPLGFQALENGRRATAVFGPPGADLAIVGFDSSDEVYPIFASNDPFIVEISIVNIGQSGTTVSNWVDGIYLSRDTEFDVGDLEIGTATRSSALGTGETYTANITLAIPDVAPGRYHCLMVVDVGGAVIDGNRSNNVATVRLAVLDVNLAQ